MISLMSVYLVLIVMTGAVYCMWIAVYLWGTLRLSHGTNKEESKVSVIVPARNEEKNLQKCLDALVSQSYAPANYEVIVVNDGSTDDTRAIAKSFEQNHHHFRVLDAQPCPPIMAPKVNALASGYERSRHGFIFLTDADCVVGPDWIVRMLENFKDDVGLVCGYSETDRGTGGISRVSAHLQSLETILFLTACAGGIGSGIVLGATGQNIAFRKPEFERLGGFTRLAHVLTGEDVFLLNLWNDESRTKIRFAIQRESIVTSVPLTKLNEVYHQHKRWLSSLVFLRSRVKYFFFCLVALNSLIILGVLLSIVSGSIIISTLVVACVKSLLEFFLLLRGARLTKRYDLLPYFPLYELFQIPFVVILAITSQFQEVRWKDRVMTFR